MRQFVFCETAAHVQVALRRHLSNPIAVMPEAAWYLRKHQLKFSTLEIFYSEDELCDLAEPTLEKQIMWRDSVDDWLQDRVSSWREFDFCPTKLTMYFLKMFFDEFRIRTHVFTKFVEACRPEEIVCFESRTPMLQGWNLYPAESVYSELLPVLARRFGIGATSIKISGNSIRPEGWVPRNGWRALAAPVWSRLPVTLQTFLLRRSNTAIPETNEPSVCLGRGYDLEAVRSEAAEQQIPFVSWSTLVDLARTHIRKGASLELSDVWKDLASQSFFWDACRVDDLDFTSIAVPKLKRWWDFGVQPIWQGFRAGRNVLNEHRVSVILTPPVWTPLELGMLGAARSMHVPVALYQHGGFLGYCEHIGWDILDFSLADYTFVYGDGVRRYVLEREQRTSAKLAKPIAVGSPRLDIVRRGIDERRRASIRRKLQRGTSKPLVLYVPTNFPGYTRQLCCDSYPDVPYYEMQEQIFRLFAAHPEVQFVYKAFVSAVPNPIKRALKSICPSASWIVSPALTELIWTVDTIIIDHPSTAVLESVLSPAPLIVYADRNCLRLKEEAKGLLSRRAQVAETRDQFLQVIDRLLRAGDFRRIAQVDRSFELTYATHEGDGLSAARALAAIEQITHVPV